MSASAGAFAVLGLAPDADEAQIRRAYARHLRATRPDDDPAGFQSLNEAYRECLERARRLAALRAAAEPAAVGAAAVGAAVGATAALEPARDDGEDDVENGGADERDGQRVQPLLAQPPALAASGAAATTAAPFADRAPEFAPQIAHETGHEIEPEPEPEFDATAFLDETYLRARSEPVAALERWLAEHPGLYRFERKHMLAPMLVAYLNLQPPLYLGQLDALLRFFDLDTVHPRSAGLQARIAELRARTEARGVDLREIRFDPDPKPGKRGEHPLGGLSVSGLVYLLLALGAASRILGFAMEAAGG